MKRRLFKLCVFILALAAGGAIVNVAVAWGCVCFNPLLDPGGRQDSTHASRALRLIYDDLPGSERCTEIRYESVGRLRIRFEAGLRPLISNYDVTTDYCGLPLLSLDGQWIMRQPFYELRHGTLIPDWMPRRGDLALCEYLVRFLPLRPIWPGFAINTLFYAAILWLLFAGPGFIRRRMRRKRGLCPACAYDLRGSDSKTCPECGKVVKT